MGHSNSKITSPVSLHADVYPVLGITKSGTYYDVGYACGNSHGKINKWSKRKPVRYNSPSDLTTQQWYDARSGFNVVRKDYANDGFTLNYWEYQPPRPGTDWCRLTDFVGYNHDAKQDIYAKFSGELYTNGSPSNNFTFNGILKINQSHSQINSCTIDDIFHNEKSDHYLTLLLKDDVGRISTAKSEHPLEYYTTTMADEIVTSINIADTWLWDAEDGTQVQAMLVLASDDMYGGFSLDIEGYPAMKTFTLKRVSWTVGITWIAKVTYTEQVITDQRYVDITSISVTVSVTDEWARSNIAMRFKGRMVGTFEGGEIVQYVSNEMFIAQSEWATTNTITKNVNLSGENTRLIIPRGNTASFYLVGLISNYRMYEDDAKWDTNGINFGQQQIAIIMPS